ncbi:MAG: 30S ribosome-binding factor RbfA [Sphingomonadales bacterium]
MTRSHQSGSNQPGQNQRLLRVGEMLRHALAEVLARGDLRDPALEGVSVTVSEVRISPDLRHARVYVMPLGGHDTAVVLAGLNRSSGYLRGQVSHSVRLKYFPRFVFEIDETFDEADRIDALLRNPRVSRDLAAHHPGPDPASDDED